MLLARVAESRRAARGVGRLARDRRADAQRLRALRGAGEQGRAGARLRGHRRDVALEVRHAAGRVRRRSSTGCGIRCSRCTSRCTPTCACKLHEKYGDVGAGERADSRRTCSATSGRRTGRTSTRSSAPANADPGYSLTDDPARRSKIDAVEMVAYGERFFTSLGFAPLPQTFWERSLFVKPRDRDVVCHASAWDIDDDERPAHQDVHRAERRRTSRPSTTSWATTSTSAPTTRSRPLPRQRQRRLPRGGRRHDRAVGHAGISREDRPARQGAATVARHRPAAARRRSTRSRSCRSAC